MLDSSMDRCPTFVGFHHQNLPVASAFGQPDSGDALLKEHDYIGLSASLMIPGSGSSTGVADETPSADLKLEETDLRLGLGPLTESQKVSAHAQDIQSSHVVVKKGDFMEPLPIRRSPQLPNTAPDTQSGSDLRNGGLDSRYAFVEGASLQNVWQGTTTKSTEGARLVVPSVMAGSRLMIAPPKNGVKRVYSEVMSDATRLNAAETRPGVNGGTMIVKNGSHVQESEVKPTGNHQQSARFLNWTSSPNPAVLAPWHVGQANNLKPASIAAPKAEKTQESNDAPPPKSQVVGWPPIRSYRKNTLAANPRPAGEEAESAIFVKVNMDGVTIGRKVDLNAHACYQDLLLALEDMFQPSSSGQASSQPDTKALRLLNNSEFVLTYEDKDGDWMLVGDVPWGMFVNTVRRLRIMRGSEATGTLVPRGAEKPKGLV